ncbi:YdcF family protein [Saccharibacillus sp. JS10]|uniref:YdcF family protein n=1 Tax=Saccharibacillus sp. JS10 TaxID=2950552 RepID=UPI00210BD2D4|nr:YdcF family protein [Saccharibacillus sp. JS10]MCQ4085629.1 YdcF family protein [Saccharibacillus sp. JS10]
MSQQKSTFGKSNKRWIKRLSIILASGILLFALWVLFIQIKIGQGMDLTSTQPTDVGIVLGARLWNDEPSPALKERLDMAYEGYESGKYPVLIVSGGLDSPEMRFTEAEGMATYLEQRGIPESAIILENQATSTYENLLFSEQIMKQKGWKTATIVTHQFHGSRARDIAAFLHYDQPQFLLAEVKAQNIWQTRGRETLAYTKWLLDKSRLPEPS